MRIFKWRSKGENRPDSFTLDDTTTYYNDGYAVAARNIIDAIINRYKDVITIWDNTLIDYDIIKGKLDYSIPKEQFHFRWIWARHGNFTTLRRINKEGFLLPHNMITVDEYLFLDKPCNYAIID